MKLPDQVAKHKILAITRRNKELMTVMSWEFYEGLLETFMFLRRASERKATRKIFTRLQKSF
jgi:hypothetical protein